MIIAIVKKCSACIFVKPITEFGVDRQKLDGRARNPDHHRAYRREWEKKNKERRSAQQRARVTPEQRREYQNQWIGQICSFFARHAICQSKTGTQLNSCVREDI